MATPPPAPSYDIFISYRHNDNLDGWVTDFVQHLEKELRSTIKEPLTIYFDKNPTDGILETHNVDKSLEEKLNCSIFIPIISQTYCDPKSFAWQHEFCAFNRMAVASSRRDVRLPNGNIASRILPIRIHDIDPEDKSIIEHELGTPLRAIDFIFRSPGVNRPLNAVEGHPQDNLNKTFYRDQINKVANAIKEIIMGSRESNVVVSHSKDKLPARAVNVRRRYAWAGALVLLIAGVFGYLQFAQKATATIPDSQDKSIAVLPFVNMSNDPEQEYFSDGLSEELLNLLAKLPELRVVGRTSSFSFKGKNEDLRTIGEKLGVSYLLEGSVRKSGNNLRITGQLIQAGNGSHVWSDTYDRKIDDVFAIQDEIASRVVEQLKIKIGIAAPRAKNIEAYKLMLESRFLGEQDLPGANAKRQELMKKAVNIDSTDAGLWVELASAFTVEYENSVQRRMSIEIAEKAARKALELDPELPDAHFAMGLVLIYYFHDWEKVQTELSKAKTLSQRFSGATYSINVLMGRFDLALEDALRDVKYDPLNPVSVSNAAEAYAVLGDLERAIEYQRKLLDLTPFSDAGHAQLASALNKSGSTDEALRQLDKVSDKTSPRYLHYCFNIYFMRGEYRESEKYLQKLIELDEKPLDNSFSIAACYAYQGKNESAIRWLNVAYERRNPTLGWIYVLASKRAQNTTKNGFPGLRNDPQFKVLLKKMNFPDTFNN